MFFCDNISSAYRRKILSLHLVQNSHRKLVDLSWGKTNLKLLSGARFLGGILYNRDRYSLNSDNGCLVLMIDCQAKTTVGDWWSGPLLYCIILECKPSATLFYEQSIKDWGYYEWQSRHFEEIVNCDDERASFLA